jgi:hypothetical protein
MAKTALGVVAGLAVWMIVATVAGLIMRNAWPAYAAVADAMTFTLPMMIARLSIGVVATVLAGRVTAGITCGSTKATLLTGAILLLVFIPVHITIWDKFPVWYHLTFLVSLVPLTFLGGRWPAISGSRRRENSIAAKPASIGARRM